jgi:poly(hydroxyalkanoate) depolymerase family esterase
MVRPKRAGAAALAARWGGLPWGAPNTSWQPSLIEETEFGSNPGDLRMLSFVPRKARAGAPLVVALHGCGQTAASYDHGIGWSRLAERLGFALLLPEQKRSNNFNRCFGWFCPGDMERDAGEPLSIRQMIARMVSDHRLDPARVFITGLSAGGAMTCTMLATYPDVFAGGAIVAGMPYKSAYGRMDALSAMVHGRVRPAAIWAGLVRTASPHRGNWPRVSVWHGTEDRTVNPVNGAEVVKQWVGVHRAARMPVAVDRVNGHRRRAWLNKAGVAMVEEYVVDGMAHGTPVRAGNKQRPVMTAPYVFDMGIACAEHVAWFWGLAKRRPGRWTKRNPK